MACEKLATARATPCKTQRLQDVGGNTKIGGNLKKMNALIVSMFHSVPGVPRIKMERITGMLMKNSCYING